jgi:hypothetical protein
MKRRASASAWFVTVQVFTTHTDASPQWSAWTAPRASSSCRIRSPSYWFALQPKVRMVTCMGGATGRRAGG